jgi:hypothetical protein
LAAVDAPALAPQRLAASVAPLVGDLRPALEAAAEPQSQRAVRLEQELAPASPRLLPGLAV